MINNRLRIAIKNFFSMKSIFRSFQLIKKISIYTFIIVNLAIMYIDGLPDKSPLGKLFTEFTPIARYQAFAMIYQPWSMFAPNPMNSNAFLQAEVLFKDGSKRAWEFPRQNLMTGLRRVLVGDRYRLYAQESLKPGEVELMWQDASKFVARLITFEEEAAGTLRTIEKITFYRFSNTILPPPEAPFIPHGQISQKYDINQVYDFIPTINQVTYDYKNNN